MTLFLLFSHVLTEIQVAEAYTFLHVDRIQYLPSDLQTSWSQVPAEDGSLITYARPFIQWLKSEAIPGDKVLIQGDFGLSFLVVQACYQMKLTALYATAYRKSRERRTSQGEVEKLVVFEHVKFRAYERLPFLASN